MAVEGYFLLLKEIANRRPINKAEFYRSLATSCPTRSPKAFERKFQNISAILYEQKQPYAPGLKPLGNYQNLLKLIVLERIQRTPLPALEPHQILQQQLSALSTRDLEVTKKGTGRYGLAVEQALGLAQNSSKKADFMGIELKTKSDGSLQTLFSRTPSRYIGESDKKSFFNSYAYNDQKRQRKALSTSFTSVQDSLGFSLRVSDLTIQVLNGNNVELEYDAERIEEALLTKHSQTAFLSVSPRSNKVRIESAVYCKHASVIRFLDLTQQGYINLDLTMAQNDAGGIRDHGFLWRIHPSVLEKLYLSAKELDLTA